MATHCVGESFAGLSQARTLLQKSGASLALSALGCDQGLFSGQLLGEPAAPVAGDSLTCSFLHGSGAGRNVRVRIERCSLQLHSAREGYLRRYTPRTTKSGDAGRKSCDNSERIQPETPFDPDQPGG